MPKFTKEFVYRDPIVTVTYPAGWEGRLPMERYQAARAAGAFLPPVNIEGQPGDDVGGESETDAQ